MRGRRSSAALAALAFAFFFVPALAYVAGTRGHPVENRPAAAFPDLAEAGFDAPGPITSWALDRLPLRPDAITARVRLTRALFGELPANVVPTGPEGVGRLGRLTTGAASTAAALDRSQQVLLGRHGWLFLGEEFSLACAPEQPRAAVVAGVLRLARILRASGRRLVLAVAPDKSTLSPGFWPVDLPERGCARREKRLRLAALRALAAQVDTVDLAAALSAQQRRTGPIYEREDTHWDQLGMTIYARALADRLDPRLARGTRVVAAGRGAHTGDLSLKAGDPRRRPDALYAVRRAGITTRAAGRREVAPGWTLRRFRSSAGPAGARLYSPATVLYGDSFTEVSLPKLLPYFRDVVRVPELGRAALGGYLPSAQAAFVGRVQASRTLVVEVAERIFWGRRPGSVVDPRLLDRLERALRRAP